MVFFLWLFDYLNHFTSLLAYVFQFISYSYHPGLLSDLYSSLFFSVGITCSKSHSIFSSCNSGSFSYLVPTFSLRFLPFAPRKVPYHLILDLSHIPVHESVREKSSIRHQTMDPVLPQNLYIYISRFLFFISRKRMRVIYQNEILQLEVQANFLPRSEARDEILFRVLKTCLSNFYVFSSEFSNLVRLFLLVILTSNSKLLESFIFLIIYLSFLYFLKLICSNEKNNSMIF